MSAAIAFSQSAECGGANDAPYGAELGMMKELTALTVGSDNVVTF